MPKYEIVPATGGGAVLDILSEDSKEDKQTLTFEWVDKGDAIAEAMQCAERYEADNKFAFDANQLVEAILHDEFTHEVEHIQRRHLE